MRSNTQAIRIVARAAVLAALPWALADFAPAALQPQRPTSPGTTVWEVQNQRDLGGVVQSGAFDRASGTAYLATLANLYEVRDGKVRLVSEPPAPGAQVQLAPGGKLFAWLVAAPPVHSLWVVERRGGDDESALVPQDQRAEAERRVVQPELSEPSARDVHQENGVHALRSPPPTNPAAPSGERRRW